MATKQVLELLAFTFDYASSSLKLLPIHFFKQKSNHWKVTNVRIDKRIKHLWTIIFLSSVFLTFMEIYLSLLQTKPMNLLNVFYHVFQLLAKLAIYSSILMFNFKSSEITHFFNCITKTGELGFQNSNIAISGLKVYTFLVQICAFSTFIFFLLLPSVVVAAVPCIHDTLLNKYLFGSCSSFSFRLFLLLVQMLFLLPISAVAPVATTSCLMTLKEIGISLEYLL